MTDPQQWNRYAYARNNPFKWVDATGRSITCVTGAGCSGYAESVGVSAAFSPSNSLSPGLGGDSWGGGVVCDNAPTGEEGWYAEYNDKGDCYGWFFQGSGGRGGDPVPISSTPPPLPPSESTASPDDEPPTEPPPCRDALCEVIRDTARRTAPFSSALEWLAATGLQVGSLVNPWIALGHCAIIGCSPAEVALAALPPIKFLKVRPNPGLDGGISMHVIERIGEDAISVTHQVTRDGKIIHQHQTHIGKYGSHRRFPSEWVEYPTIP